MSNQNWTELLRALTDNLSDEDIQLSIIQSELAAAIIRKRNVLNMTQSEFADYLGIKQSQVSKLEKGEINSTLRNLVHLANVLNLNLTVRLDRPNEATDSVVYSPPSQPKLLDIRDYLSENSKEMSYSEKSYVACPYHYDDIREM